MYSQALNIKRIGDNYKLGNHLCKLKQSFFKANYPQKMVNNILDKVKSMPHVLQRKIQPAHNDNNDNRIRVINTYGCDTVLVDIFENTSKMLKSSKMFCKSNLGNPYKFTKRVGPLIFLPNNGLAEVVNDTRSHGLLDIEHIGINLRKAPIREELQTFKDLYLH